MKWQSNWPHFSSAVSFFSTLTTERCIEWRHHAKIFVFTCIVRVNGENRRRKFLNTYLTSLETMPHVRRLSTSGVMSTQVAYEIPYKTSLILADQSLRKRMRKFPKCLILLRNTLNQHLPPLPTPSIYLARQCSAHDVLKASMEIFRKIPENRFVFELENLQQHCVKVISAHGDYVTM